MDSRLRGNDDQGVVIALDLGTTGNRAIAFNRDGSIAFSSYYEFPQYFPQPGWVEHDALEIWETTQRALKDVLSQLSGRPVVSIGITNQRETTVIWDKTTGTPIHNAIVWQCRRTAKRCQELSSYKGAIKVKTGLILDPYFSATKIEWLLKDVSSTDNLLFGTIDSWVMWCLTGGRCHATDCSNASRTMLYNIHTGDYDDDLLDLFSVPRSILPEVKPSAGFFAMSDESITGEPIPIHGVIGDQQAALFTQCGFDTTRIKNTYGTGLFVVANTGSSIPKTESLINTVAWEIEGKRTYALEGSVFVGGSAIQWLRDGLELFQNAKETESLAQSVNDTGGVYFVPALTGLGAPYWNADARGLMTGLTRGTTKAHIVRATLESLAYQTKDVIEEIKKCLPAQSWSSLRVDGGATANDFLMHFQADILNLTIEKPSITETTAFGAAGMAGIASGFWDINTFHSLNPITQTYTPQFTQERIENLYSGWQSAINLLTC